MLRIIFYLCVACVCAFLVAFELISVVAPFVMFPGFYSSRSTNLIPATNRYEPMVVSDSVREGILETHQGNFLHYAEIVPTQNITEIDGLGNAVPRANTLIFYLHGNALTLDTMWKKVCEDLSRDTGLPVVTHDYTGYGLSSSNVLDVHSVVEDAACLLSKTMEALGTTQVVLFGRSIGAAVAVHLASRLKRTVDVKLVLETPMLGTKHLRRWFGISALCSEKFDCRKCLESTSHVPMLVGLAGRDFIINNDSVIDLLKKWRRTITEVFIDHTADHNHMSQTQWKKKLLVFLFKK